MLLCCWIGEGGGGRFCQVGSKFGRGHAFGTMCIGSVRWLLRSRRLCRRARIWFGRLGIPICRSSCRSRSVLLPGRGCTAGLVVMRGVGRALLPMGFRRRFLLALGLLRRCWGMRCRWMCLRGGRCLSRRGRLVRGWTCRRVFLRRRTVRCCYLCIGRGSSALYLWGRPAMG